MPLRILFCGTPAFGLPTLELLLKDSYFSVEAVFTQPDRSRGRGLESAQSPIKQAAVRAGVAVHQPERIRSDAAAELIAKIHPDAAVIIAYGQIVPRALLDVPRLGWINLHASLLPKYRGAAPVQRAILAGERQTGLTMMRIDAGLDTGPILEQMPVEIGVDETAPELLERMSGLGAPMIVETLRRLERDELAPKAQDDSLATYALPLRKEEGRIDWEETASAIYNRMRAFDPWPGTHTKFRGRLCHVWGKPAGRNAVVRAHGPCGAILQQGQDILIACGEDSWLRLAFVHLEGRKRVTAAEFANGAHLTSDERFGS